MKILVDENIPYGLEAFGALGDVESAHGRSISNEMLKGVDALIVRSITRVNEALLEDTPVRFVGTCTIGEDHIDKEYLKRQGIAFSSAPGCNANSVAEYIVTALLHLAEKYGFDLAEKTLGIVGVGNVGSKVYRKATALGMRCVLNDPPLADKTDDPIYQPLTDILDCDIITLHTPLEKRGKYPTWRLVDKEFLRWLRPDTLLFNTSRGGVVDNFDLEEALRTDRILGAVLDVWENEPEPNIALLEQTEIATPHIAGYSFDGKVNGTRQIYEALCATLDIPPEWDPAPLLPPPPIPELTVDAGAPDAVARAALHVYDLLQDDARLREIIALPREEQGPWFDRLRKEYPIRREFFNTSVRLSEPNESLARLLSGIGFTLL